MTKRAPAETRADASMVSQSKSRQLGAASKGTGLRVGQEGRRRGGTSGYVVLLMEQRALSNLKRKISNARRGDKFFWDDAVNMVFSVSYFISDRITRKLLTIDVITLHTIRASAEVSAGLKVLE